MRNKFSLKGVFVITIFVILLTASTVFAESVELRQEVGKIVNDVIEKKGIDKEKIKNVKSVDYENLPGAIEIENIDDTNLVIYEVEIENEDSVYVITASNELFEGLSKTSVAEVLILNFGYEGEMKKKDEFLDTATGIETSLEKGYVMMRDGSITGLSTNLEVVRGEGDINVVVYINGNKVEFENSFIGNANEVKKDYDVQSEGTVKFEAGDVISVSVEADGDVVWKDVITMVEITTER